MQDWDRLVMIGVGVGVSIYTGWQGWHFFKQKRYMAAVGAGVLIVGAIGVPILLAMFAT